MATRRSRRHELAGIIETNAGVDRLAVYPSPPETLTSPSVVIGPARPYQELDSYCRDLLRLRLTVTVPRNAGQDALDTLDDTLDAIQAAVLTDPAWTWATVDAAGLTVDIGGAQHYSATATIERQL